MRSIPPWREEDSDAQAPWLRSAVEPTAMVLARSINAVAVVNPVNLTRRDPAVNAKARCDLRLPAEADRTCPVSLTETPYAGIIVSCDLPAPR